MSQSETVEMYRVELEQLLGHLYEAVDLYRALGKEKGVNFKISRYGRVLVLLNLWIDRIERILKWR